MKRLEAKKASLQKSFDDLYAKENPTEEELQQLEAIEEALAQVEADLAEDEPEEPAIGDSPIVPMPEEAKNYVVPEGEENHVHIRMYIGSRFDPNTGKEVAKYNIQKFNVGDFKNFEKQATRLGYKFGFMHKPKGFKSEFEK